MKSQFTNDRGDTQGNPIRYSPKRIEDYVVIVEGSPVGPGTNAALLRDPVAWNLYWLSYPNLEDHLLAGGNPTPIFPGTDPLVDAVLVTSTQSVGAVFLRDLVAHLSPADLIFHLRSRPIENLSLATFFKTETWLVVMESRAPLFHPQQTARSRTRVLH